jgi:hypothetical protein|tara:strand:- start:268 stop:1116 length:849 start_codon:yes stop_codon:yes gene_type:complete
MKISRKEFVRELKEEELLRENVRKAIRIVVHRRKEGERVELMEENRLRGIVRNMIINEVAVADTDPTPHQSTGINVLEDLLKKIIPVLEDDFKILTTSKDQRKSFRAHVVNAAKNTLAPVKAAMHAGDDTKAEEIQEQDVEVKIGDSGGPEDDDAFIDIRSDKEKSGEAEPELSPEEEFGQGVNDQDLTGRNMAYSSYKKIETNILDAYELLSDDEDRELFYDYLVTNLKLYFDKFEDELAGKLEEPTTPEYEEAKDDLDAESPAEGEEEMFGDEEEVEFEL